MAHSASNRVETQTKASTPTHTATHRRTNTQTQRHTNTQQINTKNNSTMPCFFFPSALSNLGSGPSWLGVQSRSRPASKRRNGAKPQTTLHGPRQETRRRSQIFAQHEQADQSGTVNMPVAELAQHKGPGARRYCTGMTKRGGGSKSPV